MSLLYCSMPMSRVIKHVGIFGLLLVCITETFSQPSPISILVDAAMVVGEMNLFLAFIGYDGSNYTTQKDDQKSMPELQQLSPIFAYFMNYNLITSKDNSPGPDLKWGLTANQEDEAGYPIIGRACIILNNLIHQGKAQSMIIEMYYCRAYSVNSILSGSLINWENLQEFKQDFLNHLLHFVEQNYRAKNDNYSCAIAGFSGGGGQTLYLGLNHPELFSKLCGFAPGMLMEEFDRNNAVAFTDPLPVNQQLKLFWIGMGKVDGSYPVNSEYLKVLDQKKIKYETFIS